MRRLLVALSVSAFVAGIAWFLLDAGTPPTTVVNPGDTLGKLARVHGVTVEELRTWNSLSGDLIQVGESLTVGPTPRPRLRLPDLGSKTRPEPVAAPEPPQATPRRNTRAARANAAQPTGVEDEGRTWPPLAAPIAKPCLDATTLGDADAAMGRSVGLDPEEVGAVVRGFQAQTLRCADEHPDVGGEILLELAIGCDGRVLRADVVEDGVGVRGYAACVADVMKHAAFPAHARDEVTTRVPLVFSAAPSDGD
jgi:hypothetical protein